MVGLRAWACRIQGLRTRNLQQGLGSSVNCLAVWRLLWLLYPPLQGSHHWVTRPHPRIPQPLPEWSLGGMTGRNCSRASPSQPQEPTSSSTLLISFCPPGKGGKKARHLGSRSMFVPSSAVKRFGEESFAGRYVSAAPDYPSPFTGIKSYCSDVHPLA